MLISGRAARSLAAGGKPATDMDPLTHACLGAAAAGSIAHRDASRFAVSIGAGAALVPDLDVLVRSSADPLLALEVPGQFTHSLVVAPVLALAVLAVVWPLGRARSSAVAIWAYALGGIVTACLLDACTSHGTALAWPLSDHRTAWGIVAVFDPLLTVALAAGVAATGAKRSPAGATWSLLAAAAYLGLGWMQSERATYVAGTVARDRGHRVERMVVAPTLGNLVLWRSVYRSQGRYYADGLRLGLLGNIVIYVGASAPAADPGALGLVPGSGQARDAERFADLSGGYTIVDPHDERVLADVRDAILPDRIEPVRGIRLDPDAPDDPVQVVTFGRWSLATFEHFAGRVLGAPAQEAPPGDRTPDAGG